MAQGLFKSSLIVCEASCDDRANTTAIGLIQTDEGKRSGKDHRAPGYSELVARSVSLDPNCCKLKVRSGLQEPDHCELEVGSGLPDRDRCELEVGPGLPDLDRCELEVGSGLPDPDRCELEVGSGLPDPDRCELEELLEPLGSSTLFFPSCSRFRLLLEGSLLPCPGSLVFKNSSASMYFPTLPASSTKVAGRFL